MSVILHKQDGGGTAYCPLCYFRINIDNQVELLKWWNYLVSVKDSALNKVAEVLEKFFDIKCSVCQRKITMGYNLLHYNSKKGAIVCDDCVNMYPKESNELLF
jgi:transcription elongation factor Elf1